MKRFAILLAAPLLLGGCGLPTLFTGVADGPNGRTNAGAGLVTWSHPSDMRCPDGGFQGAINAASFSGTCEFGPDGTRKESFNLTGADSGSIIAAVLAAQIQQNRDGAAALNQALGTLASVAASAATGGVVPPKVPQLPPSTPQVGIDPTGLR